MRFQTQGKNAKRTIFSSVLRLLISNIQAQRSNPLFVLPALAANLPSEKFASWEELVSFSEFLLHWPSLCRSPSLNPAFAAHACWLTPSLLHDWLLYQC